MSDVLYRTAGRNGKHKFYGNGGYTLIFEAIPCQAQEWYPPAEVEKGELLHELEERRIAYTEYPLGGLSV